MIPYVPDAAARRIGRAPQYFFDNALIESVHDVTRVWHRPEKRPDAVLRPDRPWEHVTYFTCNAWNVLRDPDDGGLKCFYEDWIVDPAKIHFESETDNIIRASFLPPYGSRLLVATSDDGTAWEKPDWGLRAEDGRGTNIVLGSPDGGAVHAPNIFLDPLDDDPQRRFKMIYDLKTEEVYRTVRFASSPDGVRWTPDERAPLFGWMGPEMLQLEDVFLIAVDEESRTYRLMARHGFQQAGYVESRQPRTKSFVKPYMPLAPMHGNKRRIYLSISSDLLHWSMPQCVVGPDDTDDNLDDAFYGMATMKMADMWIGFLNVFHMVANTMDVRLLFSRDGWNWSYADHRVPFLEPTPGAWDRCMVNVPSMPIDDGDDLLVFYGGAKNHHDWWIKGPAEGLDVPEAKSMDEVEYCLGLATMRRDGYVSLDAGDAREGSFVTHVIHGAGGLLEINAACRPGGSVEIELTDPEGRPLDGYAREDCVPFDGDATSAAVRWRERDRAPEEFHGRLRVYLRKASLYSFRFAEA